MEWVEVCCNLEFLDKQTAAADFGFKEILHDNNKK
jgi:hypothetical protein